MYLCVYVCGNLRGVVSKVKKKNNNTGEGVMEKIHKGPHDIRFRSIADQSGQASALYF